MKSTRLLICALTLVGAFSFDARANLITDGGFEQPVVAVANFEDFSVGGTIASAWTLVGSLTGDVSVISEFEPTGNPLLTLEAHGGVQELDLTGDTDNGAAIGVEQSIATQTGSTYMLQFWLGDLNTSQDGTSSGLASVLVDLNGGSFETATNDNPAVAGSGGVSSPYWELFSYNFTAVGTDTTIAFINNVPSGVGFNGLDDVCVNLAPEPSSLTLLIAALVLSSLWQRARMLFRIPRSKAGRR
jgi:hypothetical protein